MQWIRRVRPALTFLLLVLTAVGCSADHQMLPQDASGSGEELGEEEKCVIPPSYPLPPASATEKDTLTRIRCHLACTDSEILAVETIREWKNTTLPVWPYFVIKVQGQSNCSAYQRLHDCERGCLLWSKTDFPGIKSCRRRCFTECKNEQGEYIPCTGKLCFWNNCLITCDRDPCLVGCELYNNKFRSSNNSKSPMSPVAPPELHILENSTTAGVYTLDLTQAMPEHGSTTARNEDGPTGVIIRIQDIQSGNMTYIQLNNPEEPLNLTAYVCRKVSVSFSVANKHGSSDYSPTLNITVYGASSGPNPRKIPNPAVNLHVTDEEDQRIGFFGHAILKVTWDHPDNMQYLDYYQVMVTPASRATQCQTSSYISGLLPSETTNHTVIARSYASGLPIQGCSYRVKVYAVGEDNYTETKYSYTVPRFNPRCIQFTCSRLWDSYQQYFSFNTTWILPPNIVYKETITEFVLRPRLINTEVRETTENVFSYEKQHMKVNETTYTHRVDGQFVPHTNMHLKYKIDFNIHWNQDNLLYVPAQYIDGCIISATSPAPSAVRNLTVKSHRLTTQNEIELSFTWNPPAVINGKRIVEYQVCIGPDPLEPQESPQSNSWTLCQGNWSATTWRTPFLAGGNSHCLYFQMRAHNEFVPSNWTKPYVIPRNIDAAVELQCSSEWDSSGTFSVNMTWSVQLSCTGIENLALFTLIPLLVDTRSGHTTAILGHNSSLRVAHVAAAEEGHSTYSYIFGGLQQLEDPSLRYKFMLRPEWGDKVLGGNFSCMVNEVLPSSLYMLSPSSTPTTASQVTEQQSHVGGLAGGAIASLLGAALLMVAIVTMLCLYHKLRKRKRQLEKIAEEPCHDPMFNIGPKKSVRVNNAVITTDEWEIPPSHVIIEDCLGEGAFGEVYHGIIRGPIVNPKVHPSMKSAICTAVAIKLLKLSAKGSERRDFLREIDMMKKVSEGQNPHVVSLIGCVTIQEPLCLITEYMKYGDLLMYLRTNRKLYTEEEVKGRENPYLELGNVSPLDLISFAYQIASGMEYLSSLCVVHRDLACRNVLIGEGKALKITDFGMSRETEEVYVQNTKGRVPLKWMAIESIVNREFTSASDVWAYGVVLWEIGTLACVPKKPRASMKTNSTLEDGIVHSDFSGFPYPSVQNEDLLSFLKSGYRMEKPDNCSPEVYSIMLECWNEEPRKRPSFSQLRAKFDALLLNEGKDAYIVLQIDTEKPYYKMEPSDSKDFLNVSPLPSRRRSQLSVDSQLHEAEKPPSNSTSASLQGSPLPSKKLHGHQSLLTTASPSPQPPRPTSLHLPYSEQQQSNPYVEEPSKPSATLAAPTKPIEDGRRRRRASDGNLQLSLCTQESVPTIQITTSPEPK